MTDAHSEIFDVLSEETSGVAEASTFDEWKNGHGKDASIVRSSMAIISLASSSLLVWILHKTKDRFSTTYHRILLGTSVFNAIFSLGNAGFGSVVPSEMNYVVWNARGNQAACDAAGFLNTLGFFASLLYSCSVNIFYLFLIRYGKSEAYIRRRVERWLHAVPISFALVVSVIFLAMEGNNATVSGLCSSAFAYVPPHCDGQEEGVVLEGYTIPCGRGGDIDALRKITGLVTLIVAPVTIGVSLFLIYRSVARQEKRMLTYGAGSLGAREIAPGTNTARDSSSNSRKVMHRAVVYTVSYFVTWITLIGYGFLNLAGVWNPEVPYPPWQTAYVYAMSILTPLQGMWTLLIFMHPKAESRRQSANGKVSWFRAFGSALWAAVTGRKAESGKKQRTTAATIQIEA